MINVDKGKSSNLRVTIGSMLDGANKSHSNLETTLLSKKSLIPPFANAANKVLAKQNEFLKNVKLRLETINWFAAAYRDPSGLAHKQEKRATNERSNMEGKEAAEKS